MSVHFHKVSLSEGLREEERGRAVDSLSSVCVEFAVGHSLHLLEVYNFHLRLRRPFSSSWTH